MDAHNIEYIKSHGDQGYPSGQWGGACLELLIQPLDLAERFRLLAEIYNVADGRHSAELDATFGPRMRMMLIRAREYGIREDAAVESLERTLSVLPLLIFQAFPEVQRAVAEYASWDWNKETS